MSVEVKHSGKNQRQPWQVWHNGRIISFEYTEQAARAAKSQKMAWLREHGED